MARKQQSFTLKAHPYNHTIKFHITRESYSRLTKDKEVHEDDSIQGLTYSKDGIIHIGIFEHDVDVLVHEITHAVIYLFDTIGMDINMQTQEAMAYLMGSLTGKAWAKIEKLKALNESIELKKNDERNRDGLLWDQFMSQGKSIL